MENLCDFEWYRTDLLELKQTVDNEILHDR